MLFRSSKQLSSVSSSGGDCSSRSTQRRQTAGAQRMTRSTARPQPTGTLCSLIMFLHLPSHLFFSVQTSNILWIFTGTRSVCSAANRSIVFTTPALIHAKTRKLEVGMKAVNITPRCCGMNESRVFLFVRGTAVKHLTKFFRLLSSTPPLLSSL